MAEAKLIHLATTESPIVEYDVPDKSEVVIGRGGVEQKVDIKILEASYTRAISRIHCILYKDDSGFHVMDKGTTGKGSKNGTYVNEKEIAFGKKVDLGNGDRLGLGKYTLELRILDESDTKVAVKTEAIKPKLKQEKSSGAPIPLEKGLEKSSGAPIELEPEKSSGAPIKSEEEPIEFDYGALTDEDDENNKDGKKDFFDAIDSPKS